MDREFKPLVIQIVIAKQVHITQQKDDVVRDGQGQDGLSRMCMRTDTGA